MVALVPDDEVLAPWAKGHLRNVPQAGAGNEHGRPVVYRGADGEEQLDFLDNDERLWPIRACIGFIC